VFTEHIRFLTWLDKQQAPGVSAPTLAAMTAQDVLRYRDYIKATFPNQHNARVFARAVVRHFWRWRNQIVVDRLSFDPGHVEGWNEKQQSRHHRENATERIPEQVFGPVLAWSLRFVDLFAPDIIAADRAWRERRDRARNATADSRGPGRTVRADLQRWLDDQVTRGRPLPGWRGQPNVYFIANTIGWNHSTVQKHRELLDSAIDVVGLLPHTVLDLPVHAQLDGQQWIDGFATDHNHPESTACLARHLQAACYITIAYLSGMRDCEVKHLRRGSLRIDRDENGKPYRWKVASLAFKQENDPEGVPAVWVVGESAARAVQVLEALQPPGTDDLFARLEHSPGSKSTHTTATLINTATNAQMNNFLAWINAYCARNGRDDTVPDVNKQPWHLSTRQWRRTLAWFIARHPGGSIAGAMQYRHHSIHMFEGYAGTSDSGFRAEVESEQSLSPWRTADDHDRCARTPATRRPRRCRSRTPPGSTRHTSPLPGQRRHRSTAVASHHDQERSGRLSREIRHLRP
jgi:integrase